MYDYHLHSINSPDGWLTIEEVCQIALSMGLKEIAFTEHLDYDCPGNVNLIVDDQKYSRDIQEAREKYHGLLHVVKGLEVGWQPQVTEASAHFITQHHFDFIIGSVHHVNGQELFNGDFCQGRTRDEVYRTYLQAVYNMVKGFPYFHVLAHLDVIRRFKGFSDRTMTTREFPDVLDAILKQLVDTGKGIEVNSSGFRNGLNDTLPGVDVVKRYRELGGEVVTVGSDAHRSQAVGFKIPEAFQVLKEAGFNYVCLFRKGRHIKVPLP